MRSTPSGCSIRFVPTPPFDPPLPVPPSQPDICRCDACGDRIGAYEPVIYEIGRLTGRTSLAANPSLNRLTGTRLFHAACHGLRLNPQDRP